MEDEGRSKRRKCRILALLLGGGGSVLLTAIAVTTGVSLSSTSSETGKQLNGTEQFTTEFASTAQELTTIRASPTTTKHTDITHSTINDITNEIDDTTDYSYSNVSTKDGTKGQYEESTTDDSEGQEEHTTVDNRWRHYTTAVMLEQITTTSTVVQCRHPKNIENGETVIQNGTELGARVRYACHDGYELQGGSPIIECLENGEWRELNATCNLVSCGELTGIDHGHVSFADGTVYGSEAVYQCDEGHYILGNVTRQCGQDKLWSGESPVCQVVHCGVPPDIDNGYHVYNDTVYLSELRYKCYGGYILENGDVTLCGADRNWNENQANCTVVYCSQPHHINNGYAVYNDSAYLSELRYKCYEGYVLENGDVTLCGADGNWNENQANCTVVYCSQPHDINNGYAVYNDTVYLSELRYKCHEGYVLENGNVTVCGGDGYWNENHANCRAIECERPASIDNGGVSEYGTSYMSVSSYNCHSGYIMIGNSSRLCGNDETWSGSAPECISSTLFYCNYALVTDCQETHEGNWLIYSMTHSRPIADAKGIIMTSMDQPAELTTPAMAKYSGEACLAIEFYLNKGDTDIIVHSESMGSEGQKMKILETCYNIGNMRNFSMTLDLIAGDKVSISVSQSDGYQGSVNFHFRSISITAGQCDGDASTLTGTLSSPNYPETYSNSLETLENINVPYGMKIKITFSDLFEIEEATWLNSYRCTDFIYIHDDSTSDTALLYTCESKVPSPIISSGNSAYVYFKTDDKGKRRGWQLHWQAMDCGDCDCV